MTSLAAFVIGFTVTVTVTLALAVSIFFLLGFLAGFVAISPGDAANLRLGFAGGILALGVLMGFLIGGLAAAEEA